VFDGGSVGPLVVVVTVVVVLERNSTDTVSFTFF
jgi:hypothetical protein